MSEKILKALLQLFALIDCRPQTRTGEERNVIKSFLREQLNDDLVPIYLNIFNEFHLFYQKRFNETDLYKWYALASVRILRLCTEMNEELTQKQKVVVLFHIYEYIKSTTEFTKQELDFTSAIADVFHVPIEDKNNLKAFIFEPLGTFESKNLLIIDSQGASKQSENKHIISVTLEGRIGILHIVFSDMFIIRYTGDEEIYINGHLLYSNKSRVFNVGSSIKNSKILPIFYSDIISAFNEERTRSRIILEVSKLFYTFPSGDMGLRRMDFVERSGNMVGIMGASGTGKTTLLNVLNGNIAPTSGEVLINGMNIHTEKKKVEGVIGYVSQDDLLIEDLTVFENLYYNAKLCFNDISEFQIIRRVLRLLKNLGLHEIKNMKVGSPLNKKISGGQRKRLNIALELIREPAVLFLDEPTSGLSSRDSENILDILKQLALKGKLIFVVIHQPSSDIFKMFDKLLILDQGGYLIYNGDPVDSITYFKSRRQQANWNESECHACGNVNPEQIFNIVESQTIDEYGDSTQVRKTSPKEWNRYYVEYAKQQARRPLFARGLPKFLFRPPNLFRQFKVFVMRDLLSKIGNRQYMLLNLLETPFLAFVLTFIIKYYNVDESNTEGYSFEKNSNLTVYIFMSVIVALFVGLTSSAQEIIKDRKILKREEFLHLNRGSYLLSKVAILFAFSAVQALSFVLIGNLILEIKGMFLEYWLVLFAAWCAANLMGLNISDGFKSSVMIHIMIPFLIIPQIILSGVIVKYDKLNPTISSPENIPFYGEMITARWAYEALAVNQYIDNDYERIFYRYEKKQSNANYKTNYWLKKLEGKITECEKYLDDKQKQEQIEKNLELLRNEIQKETRVNPAFLFRVKINDLKYNTLTLNLLSKLRKDLDALKLFYQEESQQNERKQNNVVRKFEKVRGKPYLIALRQTCFNETLDKSVRNRDDYEIIMEYNCNLYQKNDQIYNTPYSLFLKAPFYSPQKSFFGFYFSTFWVNIIIIWLNVVVLYFALHRRWLSRMFAFFERWNERRKKED